jgi:hypothetical protein
MKKSFLVKSKSHIHLCSSHWVSFEFYLFCLGSDGLDIFTIKENGDLEFFDNLHDIQLFGKKKSLMIVDVAVGGSKG